jgi:hypothetical protein
MPWGDSKFCIFDAAFAAAYPVNLANQPVSLGNQSFYSLGKKASTVVDMLPRAIRARLAPFVHAEAN